MCGSNDKKRIPQDFISNYSIFLHPLPEQKQTAKILTRVDDTIQQNQTKLEQLKEVKKDLMQDLLTGKVRVKV